MEFGVRGLAFRGSGLGFGETDTLEQGFSDVLGFGVWGFAFRVWGSVFIVQGFGFGV